MISPELPQRVADMAAKQKLTFPILWDEKSAVAKAFGVAFALPEDLRQVYLGFGNDLAARNGDPAWRLRRTIANEQPVPKRDFPCRL